MLATFAYSEQRVGLNGVFIDLSGNFYAPNNAQILQDKPPVIEFDGLSQTGGQQIVNGYRDAFGADVMGNHIRSKLKEVDERLGGAGREAILAVLPKVNEKFPELMDFYTGLGLATEHSMEDVYVAAWAEDGLFAKWASELAAGNMEALKSAAQKLYDSDVPIRGCTAIGWNNGVLGQNQDMPIDMAGHGAIWKSDEVIVHAATPLFNAMAMGREMATVLNTVDLYHQGGLMDGAPISGISMSMVAKFDDAMKARDTLAELEVNAAYSTHYVDKKGKILTVENQRGKNIVIDGSARGYITHSNHPLGREIFLVDEYAFGDARMFDKAAATTLWRNEVARAAAKYSPTKDVAALANLFRQIPVLKSPYDGNDFVTTNSVIHNLNEGCSYGTVWMPNLVDYTRVCFE